MYTPPEKELEGERDPELRMLPRMDADGDMRMAERSRRPSSCRILHVTVQCQQGRMESQDLSGKSSTSSISHAAIRIPLRCMASRMLC